MVSASFSSVKISLPHPHEVHRLEMKIFPLKLTEYHVVTDWPNCGVARESLLTGVGDFQQVAAVRGSLLALEILPEKRKTLMQGISYLERV